MTTQTTEPLYRKVGRKYVPVYSSTPWAYDSDIMDVGTWRMTYAYSDGGRRYHYDVKPDTASFEAAIMLGRVAMEKAINDKAAAHFGSTSPYTKKQLAILEKFRADMAAAGGLHPVYWCHSTSYEISQAAIDAIKNYHD